MKRLLSVHLGENAGIDFEWPAEKRIRNCEIADIMLRLLETELRPAGDAAGLVPRDTKKPLLCSFQKFVRSLKPTGNSGRTFRVQFRLSFRQPPPPCPHTPPCTPPFPPPIPPT